MTKKRIANIQVGEAEVQPDTPSHISGIKEGNNPGEASQPGIYKKGMKAYGTARRSTGINPKNRNPISDDMPNLSPA